MARFERQIMDEKKKAEASRLLKHQEGIDEAKGKQVVLTATRGSFNALLGGAIKAGYGHLHPAWGILLYLQRN